MSDKATTTPIELERRGAVVVVLASGRCVIALPDGRVARVPSEEHATRLLTEAQFPFETLRERLGGEAP